SDHRMEGLAEVRVLAADLRHARRQFGPDERARERHGAARDPRAEDEPRPLHVLRDDGGPDENPRADDAPHDDQRGVERTDPLRQTWGRFLHVPTITAMAEPDMQDSRRRSRPAPEEFP